MNANNKPHNIFNSHREAELPLSEAEDLINAISFTMKEPDISPYRYWILPHECGSGSSFVLHFKSDPQMRFAYVLQMAEYDIGQAAHPDLDELNDLAREIVFGMVPLRHCNFERDRGAAYEQFSDAYAKLIALKERLAGAASGHYVFPDADDVTQVLVYFRKDEAEKETARDA